MTRVLTRGVLTVSGAMLCLIGGALMFAPRAFLETNHVFIDRDPGLMSELIAPSGILIMTGAFMMLGAFRLRFANLALVIGASVYGSYGIGRLVSLALHGVPNASLISAMVIELASASILVALGLVSSSSERRPFKHTRSAIY